MYEAPHYLSWARRFFGQVRFDMATSGVPIASIDSVAADGPESPGDPAAAVARSRAAIAAHNDVPPDEAAPAFGTTHAVWLAYASLVAAGGPGDARDEVLIEEPGYEPLVQIAEGAGALVRRFRRGPERGYALDPGGIARALTPRTRAVVVTNPHNPSGARASDDALRAAAAAAASRGAVLLVDEAYAELGRWVDARGVFRGSARKLAPNVVAVSSLTKCYGLGPERIGWLLGPREIVARTHDAITANVGHWPACHARATLEAFARAAPLAARARAGLAGKRERVAAWIARHGLSWSAPGDDALFGFVILPGRGDLTAAIEAGARERHVLVSPGAFFGIPNGFRIAWSLPASDLDEGLERLGAALGC